MKKILSLLVCALMVLGTMSFSVFAEGGAVTEIDMDAFLALVESGNGVYDGKNITVKWSPESGCRNNISGHACPANDAPATGNTPHRVNNNNLQYQILSSLGDVEISNVNFVFVPADGVYCANTAWANSYTAVAQKQAELQILNTGKLTFTNCTFDKVLVSPWDASETYVDGCTFANVDAYALHWVRSEKAIVTNNVFNNCRSAIMLAADGDVTQISIEGNKFNDAVESGDNMRGLIQFAAGGNYANAAIMIANNVSNNNTPAFWQLNESIKNAEIAMVGNTMNTDDYVNSGTNVSLPIPSENIYTPVASTNGVPYESLQAAINDLDDGDSMVIFAGEYNYGGDFVIDESDIEIVAQGEVVINATPFFRGKKQRIEGITFNYEPKSQQMYGNSGTFVKCVFNSEGSAFQWCYPTGDVTFDECVFNPKGASNEVYAFHADEANNSNLVMRNCKILNGVVALCATYNTVTCEGTQFKGYAFNSWGTANGLTFNECHFDLERSIFVGYSPKYMAYFNDCTTESGEPIAIFKSSTNGNGTAIVDGVCVNKVAFITDAEGNTKYYETLSEAITAAVKDDVIDLMGNEVAVSSMPGVAAKNLTFKNGTMDFTSAAQGSTMLNISNNQSVKFEDMTLLIKERDDSTGMFYWIDLVHPTATAYFENCVIDFDDIQYSYICANGDGSVFLKDCEIEAAYGNFVYRAGATFENCTFDGFADLGEGDVAGNMILWAAKPCVLKNTTGYTRQFGSITENGTIAVTEGSYVYAEKVRHYYGPNGPEPNPDKYTAGLITVDKSSTLEAVEADTELFNDASEGVINTEASKIYVQYKKVDVDANGEDNLEGKDKYQIILAGVNDVAAKEIIHELASADLTFAFDGTQAVTGGAMDYAVEPAEGVSLTQKGDRFMFNYDGYKKYQESGAAIPIGTITINGYGTYTLKTDDSVTTNAVYATEIKNSIVDGFTPAAGLVINPPVPVGEDMVGSISATIKVPTKTLTIKVDFPNEVVDQAKAYQEMKVEISGNIDGVNKTIPYELGGKMLADGSYVVTVEDKLVLNNTYTVTVSGKGYRTARYAVNMNDHKELYFWNNVMDKATDVEKGEYSTFTTFLAGDILADNHINIYDLSAVVSHFAEKAGNTENAWKYVEYDLNRDGVVDSKDVAYVLVSWNK